MEVRPTPTRSPPTSYPLTPGFNKDGGPSNCFFINHCHEAPEIPWGTCGLFSACREGFFVECDRYPSNDNVISTSYIVEDRGIDCAAKCSINEECRGWSHHAESDKQDAPFVCELFGKFLELKNSGWTTYIKMCEGSPWKPGKLITTSTVHPTPSPSPEACSAPDFSYCSSVPISQPESLNVVCRSYAQTKCTSNYLVTCNAMASTANSHTKYAVDSIDLCAAECESDANCYGFETNTYLSYSSYKWMYQCKFLHDKSYTKLRASSRSRYNVYERRCSK
jgi:hypothetical protein